MFSFHKTKDSVGVARVLGSKRQVYYDDSIIDKPPKHVVDSHDAMLVSYGPRTQKRGTRTVDEPMPPKPSKQVGASLEVYGADKMSISPDRRADDNQRHALFITAPPGSGKSVLINEYATAWKQLFPQGKIIVFSAKKNDPSFTFQYQHMDAEADDKVFGIDDIVDWQADNDKEHTTPFLVIYDDTSTLSTLAVKRVMASLDSLVKVGRSHFVDVIFTNHEINDSARTKTMHSNATHHIFFPSTHRHKIAESLRTRFGLPKHAIAHILGRHDRWFCLTMQAPCWYISPTKVCTLDHLTG